MERTKSTRPSNCLNIRINSNPYPIITIKQASDISGRVVAQINDCLDRRDGRTNDFKLDYCHPFPHKDGTGKELEFSGPKLIVCNQKWDAFLEKCKVLDKVKQKQ